MPVLAYHKPKLIALAAALLRQIPSFSHLYGISWILPREADTALIPILFTLPRTQSCANVVQSEIVSADTYPCPLDVIHLVSCLESADIVNYHHAVPFYLILAALSLSELASARFMGIGRRAPNENGICFPLMDCLIVGLPTCYPLWWENWSLV